MAGALIRALEIVEQFASAATPAQAGLDFYRAIQPFGAVGIGIRIYDGTKGSDTRRIIPGMTMQALPPSYLGSASCAYIEKLDPLPGAARRFGRPAFLWSDASPRGAKGWGAYWDAWAEHGVADGLAVHSLGHNRLMSRVSFGLSDAAIGPRERLALKMASLALVTRVAAALPGAVQTVPHLSPRERDCLSYAAQGLTDAGIAKRLGLAESTAHSYIESAKRKLGVRTRAQAIAHLIGAGLL